MSSVFSKPSMPTVTAPTTSTEETDAAAEEARRKELLEQQKSRGRASTLLTGATGDTTSANTQKKTLLGA